MYNKRFKTYSTSDIITVYKERKVTVWTVLITSQYTGCKQIHIEPVSLVSCTRLITTVTQVTANLDVYLVECL